MATFVLSTGRCGTQWLAATLKAACGDHLTVEHEPLHNGYRPRQMLGLKTPTDLDQESSRLILAHVERIEGTLEASSYMECGHPCWSSVPWLIERFSGRIRILHLVRHPVPTALSWLTHAAYEPPLLPHLKEKVLLSPFDDGVAFLEYRERWPSLTPFEKSLFYWAEVNALGLRLERMPEVPWLRLTFEELFLDTGIGRILEFLEMPARPRITGAGPEVIDQHHFKAVSALPDLGLLDRHPRVAQVAERLGYAASWADVEGLRRRYFLPGP
ncbi:MAG: sulfotransferase [Vicinamibacteria bacterium]|nr:sulfotransferase [Vicinamibacteria bacterium]